MLGAERGRWAPLALVACPGYQAAAKSCRGGCWRGGCAAAQTTGSVGARLLTSPRARGCGDDATRSHYAMPSPNHGKSRRYGVLRVCVSDGAGNGLEERPFCAVGDEHERMRVVGPDCTMAGGRSSVLGAGSGDASAMGVVAGVRGRQSGKEGGRANRVSGGARRHTIIIKSCKVRFSRSK